MAKIFYFNKKSDIISKSQSFESIIGKSPFYARGECLHKFLKLRNPNLHVLPRPVQNVV